MSASAEDTFDCAGKGGGEKDSARSQSLPAGSQHLREGRNGALSDKIGRRGKWTLITETDRMMSAMNEFEFRSEMCSKANVTLAKGYKSDCGTTSIPF